MVVAKGIFTSMFNFTQISPVAVAAIRAKRSP
jgi:hypothetical protein